MLGLVPLNCLNKLYMLIKWVDLNREQLAGAHVKDDF